MKKCIKLTPEQREELDKTLSDDDLALVAGGQLESSQHCFFSPDLSDQYEIRNNQVYLLCYRHPCNCQCCCKGTNRCIDGKHHVIRVGRNEYTPYPKGEYNHVLRYYIYIPK